MSAWEPVIGLEVHAQLLTRTKLFCACETSFGAAPNTHTCPTCLGLPGALPVLNAEAVRLAVRAALALGCTLQPYSRFSRKNYFYPDLPKGYQISQYDEPFSQGGWVEFDCEVAGEGGATRPATRRARLTRIHMEEDAGKNVHGSHEGSLIDLNRAGTPLIEIVGEPELRSAAEAASYLRALREVLMFVGVNDGNLEEGSFRCDANVSIRPTGSSTLGTRVELKNINSFRFVEKAITSEIARQADLLESNGRVIQETRGWNDALGQTYSLRSKETAQDYRYFPEPDVPPLRLSDAAMDDARRALPELPRAMRERFEQAFGLTPYAAGVLTQHPALAQFFERVSKLTGTPVVAANFVQAEVLRDVRFRGLSAEFPANSEQVGGILKLVERGDISGKQGKELYQKLKGTSCSAEDLVSELGMAQVSDPAAIRAACEHVVNECTVQVAQYRAGKTGVFGFLVGQVMKATSGRANPKLLNEVLRDVLGSE